jgi:hypothetical protein
MTSESKVTFEPLSYTLKGLEVEELASDKFLKEIKQQRPSALVAGIIVGNVDSDDIVIVSYDRKEVYS